MQKFPVKLLEVLSAKFWIIFQLPDEGELYVPTIEDCRSTVKAVVSTIGYVESGDLYTLQETYHYTWARNDEFPTNMCAREEHRCGMFIERSLRGFSTAN